VTTEILERPDTQDADTGPEMFHYVRKEKIAESAVMGTYVIALCGEKFPVTKTPRPGSPVCRSARRSTSRWCTDSPIARGRRARADPRASTPDWLCWLPPPSPEVFLRAACMPVKKGIVRA